MIQAQRAGDNHRVVQLGRQARILGLATEATELVLGLAEQASGEFAQASQTFRRLAQNHPTESAYWNNLGIVLRQDGQLDAASSALERACVLAPADPQARFNLGLVHLQQRHWLAMRETMLAALELAPGFIEARLQAAYACHVVGDTDSVQELLIDAMQWPALSASDSMRLAGMLSALGQIPTALAILEKTIASMSPVQTAESLRLQAHRVLLHERCNQLEQAHQQLNALPTSALQALADKDKLTRFDGHHAHASVAMRERKYFEAIVHYQQMLRAAPDCNTRATATFGLASAYDRQGQADNAWNALQIAHAAQQELVSEIDPSLLDPTRAPLDIRAHPVSPQQYANWKSVATPTAAESPVFVVGFPRSGTTLLEQMLDAHPAFRSLDERPFIHDLIQRMEQNGQHYPDDLEHLSPQEINLLRAAYDKRVSNAIGDLNGRQLVDKNPLNMLCLPMILRLFPQARIILCLRHPCDVVLSCYMQHFRSPSFMAMCSSLERLADGYCTAFEKWLQHRQVFKPDVLDWRYESAVQDFPAHVAALGQFLELDNPQPMTKFAEHARKKGFIGTPSYAQVTEGVYARSVGRWQAYREWFKPELLQRLQPMLEKIQYSV